MMTSLICVGQPAVAQSQREFFNELRNAGGFNPLGQFACFPAIGQGQDTTFTVIAFSKDFSSTLRKKGQPVPKEFLEAETSPEKDRILMQWIYRNGVETQSEPETLNAVPRSKGTMWATDVTPSDKSIRGAKLTLRMVFSAANRYSRDVLVNGVITKSIYGKCEAIE